MLSDPKKNVGVSLIIVASADDAVGLMCAPVVVGEDIMAAFEVGDGASAVR